MFKNKYIMKWLKIADTCEIYDLRTLNVWVANTRRDLFAGPQIIEKAIVGDFLFELFQAICDSRLAVNGFKSFVN